MTRPTRFTSPILGSLCAVFTLLTTAVAAPPDCGGGPAESRSNAYLPAVSKISPPAGTECESETFVDWSVAGQHYFWNSPAPTVEDPFPSACWWRLSGPPLLTSQIGHANGPTYLIDQNDDEVIAPIGFASNFNPVASPSIGDYLPVGDTLGMDSVCLVPNVEAGGETTWNGITRPTLHDSVDLITGVPLVKVTDLELPFGGATFRLNRTRSNLRDDLNSIGRGQVGSPFIEGQWWDWTGNGWMASENPILLIDSTLPDIDGDNSPTLRLVLDAHHSIPFQKIEGAPGEWRYEAPPRFRARVETVGLVDDTYAGTPRQRPAQYDIYLYDGAIKYTFVAIYDDVPPNRWDDGYFNSPQQPTDPETPSSFNDRPILPDDFTNEQDQLAHSVWAQDKNAGFGIPHYGLCVKVEDRYGHTAEIEYCGVRRQSLDDVDTTGCEECRQRCLSKGQIKQVVLKDNGTPVWTLIYVHRVFRGEVGPWFDYNAGSDEYSTLYFDAIGYVVDDYPHADSMGDPIAANTDIYSMHGSSAIDRIYVYEHDAQGGASLPTNYDCFDATHELTIPYTEDLDGSDNAGVLPTGWDYQVRYHYRADGPGGDIVDGPGQWPPVLRRTTVLEPPIEPGGGFVKRTSRVYVYSKDNPSQYEQLWLELLFDTDDIGRLQEAARQGTLKWDNGGQLNPVPLADVQEDVLSEWSFGGSAGKKNAIRPFATRQILTNYQPFGAGFVESAWPTADNLYMPNASTMTTVATEHGQYLLQPSGQLMGDSGRFTVTACKLRDDTGTERFYRVHRLAVLPSQISATPSNGAPFHLSRGGVVGPYEPFRSAYFQPFHWWSHGAGVSGSFKDDLKVATLHEARWIAVVDEFDSEDSRDSMGDFSGQMYTGASAVKAGQLSRRIVEMSPTGYILRDRTWEFGDDGIVRSGGGLGEQFIYQTVKDYFDLAEPGGGGPEFHADVPSVVKNAILQVEHRSVGWSAAELATEGDAKGLTEFYEYGELGLNAANPSVDPDDVPWSTRVQLVAKGIRRGTSIGYNGQQTSPNPKLYTTETIRNWAPTDGSDPKPTDILAEIEYLVPVTDQQSRQTTVPPTTGAPAAGIKATVYRTFFKPRDPEDPETEREVESRAIISAPRQLYPSSPWYYPVEREFYDDKGNTVWSATGLLQDPDDPGLYTMAQDPHQRLVLTAYQRDNVGRSTFMIVDTDISDNLSSASVHDDVPPGTLDTPAEIAAGLTLGDWGTRLPDDTDPLNYVTGYQYHIRHGLTDIYFPNNRRWARRVITVPMEWASGIPEDEDDTFAREFIFNEVVRDGATYTAMAPGEVNDFSDWEAKGSPWKKRRVEFEQDFATLNFQYSSAPNFTEFARVQMALDGYGRLREAELLEPDVNGIMQAVGSKLVNDLGAVYREREIDGTITRMTRSVIGHHLRTYKGTDDTGWDLGQASNMVLVDRTEYGEGVNDAWLPTTFRTYRSNPSWYTEFYTAPENLATPVVDTDGYATVTSYDWRMRPVKVQKYPQGDPSGATPLSTTLTYLDHWDRPRLVVEYGEGVVSFSGLNPDPTTLVDDNPLPAASGVLSAGGTRPLSVAEMFYGPDGTMTERRSYDVTWTGTGTLGYHAEYMYNGQGGAQVYSQRPGSPQIQTILDAVGRVSKTIELRPDAEFGAYQLARTESVYDEDGNVIESVRWVRILEDANDELSAVNAVKTRTFNWYDVHRRLIATAELGTESTSDEFIYSSGAAIRDGLAAPTLVNLQPQYDSSLDGARIWIYEYNRAGNRTREVMPDGTATEYVYGNTGRLEEKIENAFGSAAEQRITKYEYQWGRLIRMRFARANTAQGDDNDNTYLIYGADIVDEAFADMSPTGTGDNSLIGQVFDSGDALTPRFRFKYNFQGQLAERIDARGVALRFTYDDIDRLSSVEVGNYDSGSWNAGYPNSMPAGAGGAPVDRIGYVFYQYDSRHRLTDVVARVSDGGSVISHNKFSYDDHDQLIGDEQAIGMLIDVFNPSPETGYAWDYAPTDLANSGPGHHRLTTITYPSHSGAQARTVSLHYSQQTGDLNDHLSRLHEITTNFGPTSVAEFAYFGSNQRSGVELGDNEIAHTLDHSAGTVGLEGLDSFGRLKDLKYTAATGGALLYRAEHTYDVMGNRTSSLLTQADILSVNDRNNVRSVVYGYDELQRLISIDIGKLQFNGTTGAPEIDPANRLRQDSWNLDLLGNWDDAAGGRISSGNLDGHGTPWALPGADATDDLATLTQDAGPQNELDGIQLVEDSGTSNFTPEYDAAGNLIFDGEYYYQYDAWNRLLQVNYAEGAGQQQIFHMVKNYTYDGSGRLIRAQSPYPDPQTTSGEIRSERFYYDGVRRIQELIIDPVVGVGTGMATQDPELQQVFEETVENPELLDPSGSTSGFETGQLGLGSGAPTTYVVREYIWGPGDRGVDELLVQYDENGDDWWALVDANGDVVALCDLNDLGGAARVVAQWAYDPYGEVIAADHIHAFANLRLAHKGLFADRLDVGVATGQGGPESPRIVPFAHLIYHNRNRAYSPGLGRFLQRDPNATAITVLSSPVYHGGALYALVAAFDLETLYGDGGNLYEYLGSNPVMRHDPMGLSWDPFDMVDDFMVADAAQKAGILSALGQSAKAGAIVAANIASWLPFPGVGVIGDAALYALGESSGEEFAAGIAMGIIPGGKIAGKFAGLVSRIGSGVWQVAAHYATKSGAGILTRKIGNAIGDVAENVIQRAKSWLNRKPKRNGVTCAGCFTAATLVWTPAGAVPIVEVEPGDDVISAEPDSLASHVATGTVTRFIEIGHSSLLLLVIEHGDGTREVLRTTDEHPFHDAIYDKWLRADLLNPGDLLTTRENVAEVIAITFGNERVPVYNLSISDSPTYFVGERGLWVHNCGPTVPDAKVGFLFGATKNADKGAERAGGLARIGLYDNASNRAYLKQHLESAYNGLGEVVGKSNHNGPSIESMLFGPGGITRVQSHWDDKGNFITAWFIFPN